MRLYKAIQYVSVLLVVSVILLIISTTISVYKVIDQSKYKRMIKQRIQKIADIEDRIEYLESIKMLTEKAIERNLKSKNLDSTCKKAIIEQL